MPKLYAVNGRAVDGIQSDGGRERSDSVSKKMKQIAMFNRVLIGINE